MDYRSYQMNVREYLRYGLEAALILSAVGLCFYDSAWVFLGYPAVLVFYLKEKKKLLAEKRRKALELQFRDTVQEIAAALAAGYSAENALAEAKKDLEILYSSSLDMVQELAAMQRKMDALQAEINEMEASATSGGGAVTVTVTGKKEIKDIQIQPEVVDPDDIEMLQDLIMAAANEALRQMEEISQNEMGKLTAGLGIPGL